MLSSRLMKITTVVMLLLVASCQPAKKKDQPALKLAGIGGLVLGVDQSVKTGIGHALIDVVGEDFSTNTDDLGRFVIIDLKADQHYLLKASAPGFAKAFRWVLASADSMTAVALTLKAMPTPSVVTLPQGVETPVTVTDGVSTVKIEPGDLVDEQGNVASGEAEVHMVSYDPVNEGALLPAELIYVDATTNQYSLLVSSGMANIEIVQAEKRLQVAPDQTLTWEFDYADELAGRFASSAPDLWVFDESLGVWSNEGKSTVDTGVGLLTGELPHLSLHNFDECMAAAACLYIHETSDAQLATVTLEYKPTTVTLPLGVDQNGLSIAAQDHGSGCWNIGCGFSTGMIGDGSQDKVPVLFEWHLGSKEVQAPRMQCSGNGRTDACWANNNNNPDKDPSIAKCGVLYYRVVPPGSTCTDVTGSCQHTSECCPGLVCTNSYCVIKGLVLARVMPVIPQGNRVIAAMVLSATMVCVCSIPERLQGPPQNIAMYPRKLSFERVGSNSGPAVSTLEN